MIVIGHFHFGLYTGLAGIHWQSHKKISRSFRMLPCFILGRTINVYWAVCFFYMVFKPIIFFLCRGKEPKKGEGKA